MNEPPPGPQGTPGEKGDPGEPGMTAAARRAFGILAVTVFALAAAALFIGIRQINAIHVQETRLEHAIHAQCRFDRDIGGAPITVNAAGKASRLAVEIVADARAAFRGLGCAGRLTPPAPPLRRWARYYHLHLT